MTHPTITARSNSGHYTSDLDSPLGGLPDDRHRAGDLSSVSERPGALARPVSTDRRSDLDGARGSVVHLQEQGRSQEHQDRASGPRPPHTPAGLPRLGNDRPLPNLGSPGTGTVELAAWPGHRRASVEVQGRLSGAVESPAKQAVGWADLARPGVGDATWFHARHPRHQREGALSGST